MTAVARQAFLAGSLAPVLLAAVVSIQCRPRDNAATNGASSVSSATAMPPAEKPRATSSVAAFSAAARSGAVPSGSAATQPPKRSSAAALFRQVAEEPEAAVHFLKGKTTYINGAQTIKAAMDGSGRAYVSLGAVYEGKTYNAMCETERKGTLWAAASGPHPVTVYVEAILEDVVRNYDGQENYAVFRDCHLLMTK